MADEDKNWERSVLERLAFGALKEQRRARRWGIFFKLATLAYFTVLLLLLFDWSPETELGGGHTALVDIDGVINADGNASAENISKSLRAALKDKNTRGVVLRINSPGGSPVQAGIIHDEIRRLRSVYPEIPIYAVVEDICASGGYYIAAAAERIYVDQASLIGSIGVIMNQFGFVEAIDKLGIERRLLTSGDNKAFLDPFEPLKAEHVEHAQRMLDEIHQQFIEAVKQGRGERLKDTPELYSGLVWTGARSLEIGLADELGNVQSVARDVIKAEQVADFTQREGLAQRFAKRLGTTLADSVTAAMMRLGASLH